VEAQTPRKAGRGVRKGAAAGAVEGRQTHLWSTASQWQGRREMAVDEGSQETLFMI